MEGPFDMGRKGCEFLGCYTHFVTFNIPLTHDLDLGFSRSNFEKVISQEWDGRLTWIKKMWVDRILDPYCDIQFTPHPWPWPWMFKVKFWKCCISGMGGPIDKERKGGESIGCYTHFVTLNHDIDLGFSRSNFEKVVSHEWDGHWNGTKGMWVDRMLDSYFDFKLWPHPRPCPWIFKVKYGNCCNSAMGGLTHLEWKGCELDMMLDAQWDWPAATVHGK